MKTLTIIGAGKVGKVLGRQFVQHGVFRLSQVVNRSLDSAQQAVQFIGAGEAVAQAMQLQRTDLYLLAVSDDQISAVCAQLAAFGVLDQASVVCHCSGAKVSSELAAASAAGAAVASLHPVRSFADIAQVSADFAGTICSLEGDTAALALLQPALQAIGARTVQIQAEAKLVYHAGSVFASNYLVSLIDTALRAYEAAGVPAELAQAMAEPLARQSLDNAFRLGTATALTGPIARGDTDTVNRQAQAVAAWDAQAGQLYQSFVAPTQALAARKRPA
jgi:predicted short-subunit dehydrogenase-like oxidoreductase (DUF2520 family)